jgi:hypothetical protein
MNRQRVRLRLSRDREGAVLFEYVTFKALAQFGWSLRIRSIEQDVTVRSDH